MKFGLGGIFAIGFAFWSSYAADIQSSSHNSGAPEPAQQSSGMDPQRVFRVNFDDFKPIRSAYREALICLQDEMNIPEEDTRFQQFKKNMMLTCDAVTLTEHPNMDQINVPVELSLKVLYELIAKERSEVLNYLVAKGFMITRKMVHEVISGMISHNAVEGLGPFIAEDGCIGPVDGIEKMFFEILGQCRNPEAYELRNVKTIQVPSGGNVHKDAFLFTIAAPKAVNEIKQDLNLNELKEYLKSRGLDSFLHEVWPKREPSDLIGAVRAVFTILDSVNQLGTSNGAMVSTAFQIWMHQEYPDELAAKDSLRENVFGQVKEDRKDFKTLMQEHSRQRRKYNKRYTQNDSLHIFKDYMLDRKPDLILDHLRPGLHPRRRSFCQVPLEERKLKFLEVRPDKHYQKTGHMFCHFKVRAGTMDGLVYEEDLDFKMPFAYETNSAIPKHGMSLASLSNALARDLYVPVIEPGPPEDWTAEVIEQQVKIFMHALETQILLWHIPVFKRLLECYKYPSKKNPSMKPGLIVQITECDAQSIYKFVLWPYDYDLKQFWGSYAMIDIGFGELKKVVKAITGADLPDVEFPDSSINGSNTKKQQKAINDFLKNVYIERYETPHNLAALEKKKPKSTLGSTRRKKQNDQSFGSKLKGFFTSSSSSQEQPQQVKDNRMNQHHNFDLPPILPDMNAANRAATKLFCASGVNDVD